MTHMHDYIRDIEEHRIPELKKSLAPLESGELRLSKREYGGEWQEVTQDHIAMLKRAITTYEAILAELKPQYP